MKIDLMKLLDMVQQGGLFKSTSVVSESTPIKSNLREPFIKGRETETVETNSKFVFNDENGGRSVRIEIPGCEKTDVKIEVDETTDFYLFRINAKPSILSSQRSYRASFKVRKHIYDINKVASKVICGVLVITLPFNTKEEQKDRNPIIIPVS